MDIHSANISPEVKHDDVNLDSDEINYKNDLYQLMAQKDSVEAELKALGTVLDSVK